jgi:hypothetical protein
MSAPVVTVEGPVELTVQGVSLEGVLVLPLARQDVPQLDRVFHAA